MAPIGQMGLWHGHHTASHLRDCGWREQERVARAGVRPGRKPPPPVRKASPKREQVLVPRNYETGSSKLATWLVTSSTAAREPFTYRKEREVRTADLNKLNRSRTEPAFKHVAHVMPVHLSVTQGVFGRALRTFDGVDRVGRTALQRFPDMLDDGYAHSAGASTQNERDKGSNSSDSPRASTAATPRVAFKDTDKKPAGRLALSGQPRNLVAGSGEKQRKTLMHSNTTTWREHAQLNEDSFKPRRFKPLPRANTVQLREQRGHVYETWQLKPCVADPVLGLTVAKALEELDGLDQHEHADFVLADRTHSSPFQQEFEPPEWLTVREEPEQRPTAKVLEEREVSKGLLALHKKEEPKKETPPPSPRPPAPPEAGRGKKDKADGMLKPAVTWPASPHGGGIGRETMTKLGLRRQDTATTRGSGADKYNSTLPWNRKRNTREDEPRHARSMAFAAGSAARHQSASAKDGTPTDPARLEEPKEVQETKESKEEAPKPEAVLDVPEPPDWPRKPKPKPRFSPFHKPPAAAVSAVPEIDRPRPSEEPRTNSGWASPKKPKDDKAKPVSFWGA